MATKKEIAAGTGRRKCAVARVRLLPGDGLWTINGKPIEDMTDAEKLDFIRKMAAKGKRVIIEGFNDAGSKEKAVSEGGQMIINNTIVQKSDNPDYWTRLEHQYAGMAMEALIKNVYRAKNHEIAGMAADIAHALVEKMKEEKQ